MALNGSRSRHYSWWTDTSVTPAAIGEAEQQRQQLRAHLKFFEQCKNFVDGQSRVRRVVVDALEVRWRVLFPVRQS